MILLSAAQSTTSAGVDWFGLVLPAVLTAVGGIGGGILVGRIARSAWWTSVSSAAAETAQVTLEDKLDSLSKSMRESAKLVEEVSAELDARAATARRLQQEAEDAQALAALHKDQTEAVKRLLDTELLGQRKGIRRDTIMIGIFSFVAGVGATLLVTLLVHPIH